MLLIPWFDWKRRTLADTGCYVPPSRLGCCHPTGTPLTNPYHFFRVSIKNRNSPTQPYHFFCSNWTPLVYIYRCPFFHRSFAFFDYMSVWWDRYGCCWCCFGVCLIALVGWLGDIGHCFAFSFRVLLTLGCHTPSFRYPSNPELRVSHPRVQNLGFRV